MPTSDHKRRLTAFVVAMAVLIATPLAVVATDAFTDVSTSSVHHDNITWLKDAGVTSGCNPPDNDEYCPTDNVTRAQMATFMRNLATNQVVDAATAQTAGDADTVEGKNASELQTTITGETRAITTGAGTPISATAGAAVALASTSISSADGPVALVTTSALANHDGAAGTEGRLATWLQSGGGACSITGDFLPGSVASVQLEDGYGTASTSVVLEVGGSTTWTLCAAGVAVDFSVEEVTLNTVQSFSGSVSLAGSGGSGASPSDLLEG